MEDTVTATVESAPASAPSTLGDAAASLQAADRTLSDTPAVVTDGEPAATALESTQAPEQALATPETTPDPKPAGPIPFEVHKTALENARTKAAADKEAELKATLGWAQEIPAADGPRMAQLYQAFTADPSGFAIDLIQRLGNNPQYAAQIRSQAARVLGTRQQPAEPADIEPTADVDDPTSGLKFYSADQAAKREAWVKRQLLAEVQKELQPIKQREQQMQQIAKQRELHQRATDTLTEMRKDPLFAEHEPAIKAAMLADTSLTIDAAFNRVLRNTVIPGIKSSASSEAVAELQQKAVASTRNPATAQTIAPPNMVGNARAALEWANQQLGGRS
jgi:hypothetical protein